MRTASDLRAELVAAYQAIMDGRMTVNEGYRITQRAAREIKAIRARLRRK